METSTVTAVTAASPNSKLIRVIRRNRTLAAFDQGKVHRAVTAAFAAERVNQPSMVSAIVDAVVSRVRSLGSAYLHVEQVQDIVVQELMRAATTHGGDLFRVTTSYVTFRANRAKERAQRGEVENTTNISMKVAKPDGSVVIWDGADLIERVKFALAGLNPVMPFERIVEELRRSLFEEMPVADLHKTLQLNAKTLQQYDSDFSVFAARFLLTYIYEEVLGWDILRDGVARLREFHAKKFKSYIERGIAIKRLSPRALEYDLDKLSTLLDPSADYDFDFLGIQTLYDRYLIIDKTGDKHIRLETPQFFWMRVSMGLFLDEKAEHKEDLVGKLYELYRTRRFCSSTPTLFNAMTLHSQLSSCYLYYVGDDLDSIFDRGIRENAQLSKWAGGLGGSWTAVRGTGAHIQGTNGESQGVIPFLKIHNDQLVAVNQGGKRKGSGCAYIESWHNDIFEFLELRKNTGDERRRTHDMNTANWIPDLFMKRMESREQWTLFRSSETPDLHELYGKKFEEAYVRYEQMADDGKIFGHKVDAIELWKRMLSMLFETGHPWITFKDACNIRSPQDHAGVIHSSNLCTEITLNTSKDETAVCNLGSVIISTHLDEHGRLDVLKLRETIKIAVRALDNVIDLNYYPTEAAKRSNMRHRPIGLGVMGLHDALQAKGLPFDSEAALDFNTEFMEAVAFFAYETSSDLAAERGAYSSYKGSKWDRGILPQDTIDILEQERGAKVDVPRGGKLNWQPIREKIAKQGMRNSNCIAIAPTATISNITATSPCIEPFYKNIFVKSNLSGEFVVVNPHLVRELKKRGLWTLNMAQVIKDLDGEIHTIEEIPADVKALFKTAFAIDFKWVIDAGARRGVWIDQAQSLNLWLKQPDIKMLSHMYRRAWTTGLKTTYYLRSQGASGIEKSTGAGKKEVRGIVAGPTPDAQPKTYSAEEKKACSIEAMKNGGECEACQ